MKPQAAGILTYFKDYGKIAGKRIFAKPVNPYDASPKGGTFLCYGGVGIEWQYPIYPRVRVISTAMLVKAASTGACGLESRTVTSCREGKRSSKAAATCAAARSMRS